jgi:hypothetical protein
MSTGNLKTGVGERGSGRKGEWEKGRVGERERERHRTHDTLRRENRSGRKGERKTQYA